MDDKFQEGDYVRVYSLQSFNNGGFINGTPGVVRQNQTGSSVLVRVERNFGGVYKMDNSYEVYPEQLRRITEKEYLEECPPHKFTRFIEGMKELLEEFS